MLSAKRVQGFRGFFFGLVFAVIWGSLLMGALYVFTSLGGEVGAFDRAIRGIELGGGVAGTLYLLHQMGLGSMVLAARRRYKWSNFFFWPALAAYHVLAFPGVFIAKLLKLVTFSSTKEIKVSKPSKSNEIPASAAGAKVFRKASS